MTKIKSWQQLIDPSSRAFEAKGHEGLPHWFTDPGLLTNDADRDLLARFRGSGKAIV